MHARSRRILAVLLALALLTAAGCGDKTAERSSGVVEQQPPRLGTVVFDMGHGEIFGAEDTSELGQSQAIERIKAAGFDVTINNDPITAEDLAEASGLIIAGPMTALSDQEYADITAFMERGGTVLLTIHVPFPVLKVPAHWGLPVGTEIVMSEGPTANPQQPSVFMTDQIAQNPITEGVGVVLVVSGWPVAAASESAQILVSTSNQAWLSAPGDQQPKRPEGTALGTYGMIGVANVGTGQIIVSGDDAVFANIAINEASNARLLDNIIRAMSMMKTT